jgi:hypothetical protein
VLHMEEQGRRLTVGLTVGSMSTTWRRRSHPRHPQLAFSTQAPRGCLTQDIMYMTATILQGWTGLRATPMALYQHLGLPMTTMMGLMLYSGAQHNG